MHILKIVLEIIVVIASILLTLLILMHKGKGGGLSDMFGGGLTQNAGTSGVAEKNLNRWTIFSAGLGRHHHRPRSDDKIQLGVSAIR